MDVNYAAAAPEIFLALAICAVLLVDVFLRDDQRETTYVLAMLALIGTAAVTAYFSSANQVITFSGSYVTDPASNVLKMFAYVALGITFLYSREYLENNGLLKGEFFVLGALAAGTLLYGISLLYGITGTLQLDQIAARVVGSEVSVPTLLALAVLIVGIWPAPLVDAMDASIGQLLDHVGQPKL